MTQPMRRRSDGHTLRPWIRGLLIECPTATEPATVTDGDQPCPRCGSTEAAPCLAG